MKSYKRVCALGFFDGVHLGHSEIIKRAEEIAAEMDATPCVLTFDRKPKTVLSGSAEKLISTSECKRKLVSSLYGGVEFFVLPFSKEFSSLSAEDFVSSVLLSVSFSLTSSTNAVSAVISLSSGTCFT